MWYDSGMKSKRAGGDRIHKCEACGDEFKTRGGQVLCGDCAMEQLLMPKMFARRLALKAQEAQA